MPSNSTEIAYRFLLYFVRIPFLVDCIKILHASNANHNNEMLLVSTIYDMLIKHKEFDLNHLNPAFEIEKLPYFSPLQSITQDSLYHHLSRFHAFSSGPLTFFQVINGDLFISISNRCYSKTSICLPSLYDIEYFPLPFQNLYPFSRLASSVIDNPQSYNPVEHLSDMLFKASNLSRLNLSKSRLINSKLRSFTPLTPDPKFEYVILYHYNSINSFFLNAISHDYSDINPFHSIYNSVIKINPLWIRNDFCESYFSCDIYIDQFLNTLSSQTIPNYSVTQRSLFLKLQTLPNDIILKISYEIFRTISACFCTTPSEYTESYHQDKIYINQPVFQITHNYEDIPFCKFKGIISTRIRNDMFSTTKPFLPSDQFVDILPYRLAHYHKPGNRHNPLFQDTPHHVSSAFDAIFNDTLLPYSTFLQTCDKSFSSYYWLS